MSTNLQTTQHPSPPERARPPSTNRHAGTVVGSYLVVLAASLAVTAAMLVGGGTAEARVLPTTSNVEEAALPALPALPVQADGAAVYAEKCATCHQPGGVGLPGSFPPLAGNPAATDPAYVEDVIRNGLSGPLEVDGVNYDAVMVAVDLSDDERAAVVEYVVGLASAEPADDTSSDDSETAAPVEPVVGDAARGRMLFTGSTTFENGGGACVSCHEAGDVGHWGGSALGPDLDASFANLGGEAGLAAWLAAPASPTMQPIFTDEPLTEAEIADLVAFLETAPDLDRPSTYGDALLLGGLGGLALLLGAMALIRQTMSPSYAQRLRSTR